MKHLSIVAIVITMALLVAPAAQAGSIITITKTEKINNSIAVTIKNELTTDMKTDPKSQDFGILHYYVGDANTTTITSESVSIIKAGTEGKVLLNKSWPTTGYSNITIHFVDSSGVTYEKESKVIFANPGLTLKEFTTIPESVYLNSSIKTTFVLLADGDGDLNILDVSLMANPKYFIPSTQDTPKFLKVGENGEFIFDFKVSGESLADTVIYTTSHVPIKITFMYQGFKTTQTFNESFPVLNRNKVGTALPDVKIAAELPESALPASKADIKVFIWSSNVGGNELCDVNLTLTSQSSHIKVPVFNILPGERYAGRVDQPDDPTTTFEVEVSSETPKGNYNLELLAQAKDCEWRIPLKEKKIITLSVKEPEAVSETTENTSAENETVNVTNETVSNLTEEANITSPSTEEKPRTVKFYAVIALIAFIVTFVVVYLLERKSRRI